MYIYFADYFRETNAEHALKLFVHSPGIYPFLQNAVIVPIGTTVYGAIRLRNVYFYKFHSRLKTILAHL